MFSAMPSVGFCSIVGFGSILDSLENERRGKCKTLDMLDAIYYIYMKCSNRVTNITLLQFLSQLSEVKRAVLTCFHI